MPRCIGRNICDRINKGKVPFYNKDPTAAKRYYHIAIQCVNSSIKDSRLCQDCTDKEKKTKTADIRNDRLYDSHESVLHDTMDKPVPLWSHIEGGVWFKSMIEIVYYCKIVEFKIQSHQPASADSMSFHRVASRKRMFNEFIRIYGNWIQMKLKFHP